MSIFSSLTGSRNQSKSEELANLVEATNTEGGITALGGITPSAKPTPPPAGKFGEEGDQSPSNAFAHQEPDPVLAKIFANETEDDYLILPGAAKVKPRSSYMNTAIGSSVSIGAMAGASYGLIKAINTKEKIATLKIARHRSETLTAVIRSARNNAIRFGTFSALVSFSGIIAEYFYGNSINKDIYAAMPSEDEIMEMQMRGQQYTPPKLREIPEDVQSNITTASIFVAGTALAMPKAIEWWNAAKKFDLLIKKNLAAASADYATAEKEFGKMFGRGASNLIKDRIKDGKLPSYMKLLAGSRIAGAVVMCGLVSYLWATQKDNTHRRIRNASSRIGVL